jgi:hypothetical protein
MTRRNREVTRAGLQTGRIIAAPPPERGLASDKIALPGGFTDIFKRSLSAMLWTLEARKHPPPHVQRREERSCNGRHPLLKQMSCARQIDRAAPAQLELFLAP